MKFRIFPILFCFVSCFLFIILACTEFLRGDSLFFIHSVNAQTPTPNIQGGTGEFSWTINGLPPGEAYIDGNTSSVEIKFYGLGASDSDLYVFPKTKQEDVVFAKELSKIGADDSGVVTMEVCGAGNDALKSPQFGKKKPCDTSGKDYFHEGHIYRLGLYDDKNGQALIMVASFYIKHSAPIIKVSSVNKGSTTAVKVELSGRRYGGNDENNYQVVLEQKGGYKSDPCMTTKKSNTKTLERGEQTDFQNPSMTESSPASKTFTRGTNNDSGLSPGTYYLKINEQVNDTGALQAGIVGAGCSGGFTYVTIPVIVSTSGIKLGEVNWSSGDFEENKKLNKADNIYPIPCVKTSADGGCESVQTAIGIINTTAEGFVGTMFKFVLMLAGFGGIIIIIYSGYMLMISRGDKEKLAAARETLTSAILGLLFIVLSIVILEIIGVDILRIPGFAR